MGVQANDGTVFPLKQTYASLNELHFRAANGTIIKNYGLRNLTALTDSCTETTVSANVAEVRSNLAGGMRIVQAENRIILDSDGSYIENKRTGHKIHIRHEDGCFMFDLWVPAKKAAVEKTTNNQGNGRKAMKANPFRVIESDNNDMEVSGVFVRQEDL